MALVFPISLVVDVVGNALGELQKRDGALGKLNQRAVAIGKSLTQNVSLPIIGVGVAAVKATADFEQGMSDVSTLVDTSTESIADMGKEVLKIGAETPVAVNDLTSALFDVRSAGIDAADQFTVLEKSAQLGVAGLGSTKEAADLVTSAINSFGLEGEKAEAVYDQIFKTTKNGKTTISGLAQGFGAVSGTVAATGTELDEYLAAVSALTTTGAPAAQVHTQLRSVMSGLTRDTAESRKVFRALGAKDFKDLIKQSGGLVNALRRIDKSAGGNESQLLNLLGSTEALNAVIGLTGEQAQAFDETLDDMRNGANAVDVAFKKQKGTLKSTGQILKNQLVATGVQIGQNLQPVLLELAEVVRDITGAFLELSPETQAFLVKAAGVAAVVGPAIIVVAKLASAIGVVIGVFQKLRILLVTNPIGAAVAGIALAATMIIAEWEHFENFFALMWRGIKSIFQAGWDFVSGILDDITGAVDSVVQAGRDLVDFVNPFSDGSDAIPSVDVNDPEQVATANRLASAFGLTPQGAPGPSGNTNITVDFANAPAGMRTTVDNRGDNSVEVGVGFNMVTQ